MFSLSTSGDCEVEKEKPRILPSMIPNLAHLFGGFPPGSGATPTSNALRNFASSTSSSSPNATPSSNNGNNGNTNLFPMFPNANFAQQYYALVQNQFMAQFAAAKNGINASNSESNSSILSDSRASSADSSTTKKLKVDNDGNVICPICDEKLAADSNWELHVEEERKNLIKSIESIKEQKQQQQNSENSNFQRSIHENRSKQKRESELQRIRSNQQKRLTLKTINPLSTATRNHHENNFDSTSSSSRSASADKNYCKGCERHHDYLIISSTLDEPRCYECFRKFRQQTTFLPLSITESPEAGGGAAADGRPPAATTPSTPSNHSVDGLLGSLMSRKRHSPASSSTSSHDSSSEGTDKRIKIEI